MKELIASSKMTASASIRIALTNSREEEAELKAALKEEKINATAADFGGEFISSKDVSLPHKEKVSSATAITKKAHLPVRQEKRSHRSLPKRSD